MANRSAERWLAELHAYRGAPHSADSIDAIRKALDAKINLVIARAAAFIAEFKLESLAADLERAFDRLWAAGPAHDPTCCGKTQIVRAMVELGERAEGVFLRGVSHVQLEPVYGGRADTAAELRGLSAHGLVIMRSSRAMPLLVDLLMDQEPQARLLAARAIAAAGKPEAGLVLRLKLLSGDRDESVVIECMSALADIQPVESIEFLARFLAYPDGAMRSAAAMAIGATRRLEALDLLKKCLQRDRHGSDADTLLLAIAQTRLAEAIETLAEIAGRSPETLAAAAIRAAAIWRHNSAVVARMQSIVAARRMPALTLAFKNAFDLSTS